MGPAAAWRGPRRRRGGRLLRPREPAFWVFALVIGVTAVLAVAAQQSLRDISPSGWALSWALLLAYLLPVGLLVYWLDQYEREPPALVAAALVWGGVAATTMAGPANSAWSEVVARLAGPDFAARWAPALTAPVTEEAVKVAGLGLLALIATDELDDLMDGLVYGAMVGLGFAVVEDVFYFLLPSPDSGAILRVFFVRVVASGLYGHVLYSGLTGMAVAYLVSRRQRASRARRLAVAGGLALVAVGAHFLWNSPWLDLFPVGDVPLGTALVAVPAAAAVKGLPFLAFLAVMVAVAHRRERRWLASAAAAELGGDWLLPGEVEVLASPWRRARERRGLRRRAGRRAAVVLRRLRREQVRLAMLRTSLDRADHPELATQRARCQALRAALGPHA